MKGEVVARGIYFPEGLAWSAQNQTLLVSSVQEGVLYRVWPTEGRKEKVADIAGGANNCALADGDGALVTQNGGLNAYLSVSRNFPDVGEWPQIRPTDPGLLHIDAQGNARYLVRAQPGVPTALDTPNDIVVAADGTVFLTDPGNPFQDRPRDPRVMAYSPQGELRVVARGFDYCNGIEIDLDGNLIVSSHSGIHRVSLDGEVSFILEDHDGPSPDGVTIDRDGRIYVAASRRAGVRVIEDGKEVDFISVPGEGSTSNCTFGGPDLNWLFATDTRSGTVTVFTGMPTPGRPATAWKEQG